MGSLTEIRANRIRVLKDVRRFQKALDTEVEKLERLLLRLLKRKLKLPQLEDLKIILEMVKKINQAMDLLMASASNAVVGFRF